MHQSRKTIMATKKTTSGRKQTKPEIEFLKSSENLLIEKEKRYQKKLKRPQVENLTMLKETKKKAAAKRTPAKKKKG